MAKERKEIKTEVKKNRSRVQYTRVRRHCRRRDAKRSSSACKAPRLRRCPPRDTACLNRHGALFAGR
ncbi:hypothetical protein BO99DRAFT_132236 [Aspergillus violaceofuscus CBS 115571]|uniref:Uncharacterized protein n=1 Tax=Aspergillus violaceofuscus (strain CBS 115571) TaxID=1450538 RepID=A0A2V5H6Q4_ASPV1|nr:hypothetical protein BO99DRAFT_132236 [Aspergillus violaceofuscus CBS 115571]